MSALAELQRQLQAHLLDRHHADAGAHAAVIGTPAADVGQRLGVYAHAYRARLAEVLGNDFHALRVLAGDDDFDALAFAYIDAHPSTHYNVRWYGAALPAFLQATSPWSAQPALAAMAQLEWNMGLAFDAADAPVVDMPAMAAVAPAEWPGMRLDLHPSLQRQSLEWNVAAIRRAVDHETPVPGLQPLAPIEAWAVWRKEATVRYRVLDADEAVALDAIGNDATFAELCEVLCEWHAVEAVAPRAAFFFRRWIDDQWVTALAPS